MLLFAAWLALAALPGIAAAKEASFALTVEQLGAGSGETIVVTVTGSDLADVYGYELNLTYDESKLEYKKSASLVQGFSVPLNPELGHVVFAHTKVGKAAGIFGKVALATITFDVIEADQAPAIIELTRVKLVKSDLSAAELAPAVKTSIMPQPAAGEIAFSDLEGHWGRATIERAVRLGIVNGYGDGTFRPNGSITRSEFVVMAARAFDLPSSSGVALQFSDAEAIPTWARPSVLEAEQAGIVQGYEDGSFRPARLISRAEMAVMVMRLHGETTGETPALAFADSDRIPAWAQPSISAVVELGVIQGKSANLFAPGEKATRAEAAAMLLRLLDAMAGADS